jgi:putative ATP-binding cassette transporter
MCRQPRRLGGDRWALAHLTRWGRQFAVLNLAYFAPGRCWASWRSAFSVLAMVWLAVADVRLTVLVSYATNGLFTAMQNFSGSDFGRFLAIFALLAALNVIVEIALYYTERMFVPALADVAQRAHGQRLADRRRLP